MNDEDNLFKLYLASRSEEIQWLNRQSLHFRHYITLVTAILALTLGGIYQFKQDVLYVVVAATLGFGVNIALCIVTINACDRAYRRFLEAVTIAAKLEGYFGLDGPRPGAGREGSPDPFSGDEHLLPKRWIVDRRKHNSGTEFANAKTREGGNLLVRKTMGILALLNLVLWVGTVFVSLIPRWCAL